MNPLSDTPKWSWFRKLTAFIAILIGSLMIARGSYMEPEAADVAKTLVTEGSSLVGWIFAFIILGASSERVAAWLPLGKKMS